MEIFNRFSLEAARRLPHLPPEHPCSRVHGHSFQIEVYLRGPLDPKLGWVTDFADIQQAWRPIHASLDHRYLNEVDGLENPTSELLAQWIWRRLWPALPGLAKIVVMETSTSGCIYQGED
ncbi:MAG: 6-carboxytetrahydropterin synthase QueD [Hydrogenophilales bacterium 28-61-23]|nr:MAG: 6-carboxytetrahydropterin synthase QueD [Hydrogenophilales bacterium 28-61-23]